MPMSDTRAVLHPAPIERLSLPEELDGQLGVNRAQEDAAKLIEADTDLAAVQAWLSEFEHSPQTQRSYRKEAERLVLWALIERRKPLSSLMREDLQAYELFLVDPQPQKLWCGPRAPRFSDRWRPFERALSKASQHQALVILNALFNHLVAAGYLKGNPLALTRRRRQNQARPSATVERFLEHDLWQAVLEDIEHMPRGSTRSTAHYERNRYLVRLLYFLGARVSEVACHTMSSFIEIRGRWWWRVLGKGQREDRVPVNKEMLEALYRYRLYHGLPALPQPGESTPLVLSIKGRGGISSNMVYRLIKAVVMRAAASLEASEPHKAVKLRQASTHWFRHTSLTHQADAGIELRYLNKNARHRKLETTSIYLHAEDEEWHDAMERHSLRNAKSSTNRKE